MVLVGGIRENIVARVGGRYFIPGLMGLNRSWLALVVTMLVLSLGWGVRWLLLVRANMTNWLDRPKLSIGLISWSALRDWWLLLVLVPILGSVSIFLLYHAITGNEVVITMVEPKEAIGAVFDEHPILTFVVPDPEVSEGGASMGG